jgi:hypothetical protein
MKKILLTIAVAALSVVLATQAQAAPKAGGGGKASPGRSGPTAAGKAAPGPKTVAPKTGLPSAKTGSSKPGQAGPKTGSSKPGHPGNGHPGNGSANKGHHNHHNYHLHHGTKFHHGYCYHGRHHNHWTVIRFDPRYGCNCYWDPCVLAWYYWCQRDVCYYPVTYCPYRCYSCTEVVTVQQTVCETCRPVTTCVPCANGQTQVAYSSTAEPPVNNNIVPIPEPAYPLPGQ